MNKSPLTFIIKTSFDCNLGCAYCYEGHRPQTERLTQETAANLITKAAEHSIANNTHVSFVWHGGEPLLLGKDFYKFILGVQKKLGPSFHYRNMIQTNGLLLDKAFASFFVKNGFDIGVSLDGPEVIHDSQRLTKSGGPSFKNAFAAISSIKKQKGSTGAVAIFTKKTLTYLDEFYEFFRNQKLSLRINPLLVLGNAADSKADALQVSPKEYGEALIHLFDRWISEPQFAFMMDPFYNILRSLVGGNIYSCGFAGKCHDFLKVFPNGDLYLCGKTNEDKDIIGNINRGDLSSITSSQQRKLYSLEKACVREACGKCNHVDICRGGCTTSASVSKNEGLSRDYYCESYRALFDHIKAVVPDGLSVTTGDSHAATYSL